MNRNNVLSPGAIQGSGSPSTRDATHFTRSNRNQIGGSMISGNKGGGGAQGFFRDPSETSLSGGLMSRAVAAGDSNAATSPPRLSSFGSFAPNRSTNASPQPELSSNLSLWNLPPVCGSPCSPINLEEIPIPENLVYDVDTFVLFDRASYEEIHSPTSSLAKERRTTSSSSSSDACPDGIMRIARRLWKSMPEHFDQLGESGNLRDKLFSDDKAVAPSKVLQERKLQNEVMGILGKVTEANLLTMQKELTALPIRQSTQEEITEVINVFFGKSTQPEDSRYTPLYVNLLVYLIDNIGSEKGEMIRKEIIYQCKETFLSGTQEKNLEEAIANLSEEEADIERMKSAAKQKANIYFLGLMFVNKLVTEIIICSLLDALTEPRSRRVRFPSESSLNSFLQLLETCGPHLSPKVKDHLVRYREMIELVKTHHPKMRFRVLFENLKETMDNNWVPRHGRFVKRENAVPASNAALNSSIGPGSSASPPSPLGGGGIGFSLNSPDSPLGASSGSLANFAHSGHTRGGEVSGGSPAGLGGGGGHRIGGGMVGSGSFFLGKENDRGSPIGDTAPPPNVPTQEEFWKAMDDCFSTWKVRVERKISDELKSMILHRMSPPLVLKYCFKAISRYVSTIRFDYERAHLGELFQDMIQENIISPGVPQEAVDLTIADAIENDYFSYLPGYFKGWNTVIRHGGNIFPASLHTTFLSRMVDNHCSPQSLQSLIGEADTFVDPEDQDAGNGNHGSTKSVLGSSKNSTNNSTTGSGALGRSSSNLREEEEGGRGGSGDDRLRGRLHLLPCILRCSPPLLCEESVAQEFQDHLLQLGAKSIEVKAFRLLVEDSSSLLGRLSTQVIKENPLNALPVLSAVFTYIRFNVGPLFERFKTQIKKICNVTNTVPFVLLLEDVYLQWSYLDAPLEQFSSFLEKIKALCIQERNVDERLREKLVKTYPPSDHLQKVVAYLKSSSGGTSPVHYAPSSSSSGSNGNSAQSSHPHGAGALGAGAVVTSSQSHSPGGAQPVGRNDSGQPQGGSSTTGSGAPAAAPRYASPRNVSSPFPARDFRPLVGSTHQSTSNPNRLSVSLPPSTRPTPALPAGESGNRGIVSSPHSLHSSKAHSPPQPITRRSGIPTGRGGGVVGVGSAIHPSSGVNSTNSNSNNLHRHSPHSPTTAASTATSVSSASHAGGPAGSASMGTNKKEKRRGG